MCPPYTYSFKSDRAKKQTVKFTSVKLKLYHMENSKTREQTMYNKMRGGGERAIHYYQSSR